MFFFCTYEYLGKLFVRRPARLLTYVALLIVLLTFVLLDNVYFPNRFMMAFVIVSWAPVYTTKIQKRGSKELTKTLTQSIARFQREQKFIGDLLDNILPKSIASEIKRWVGDPLADSDQLLTSSANYPG